MSSVSRAAGSAGRERAPRPRSDRSSRRPARPARATLRAELSPPASQAPRAPGRRTRNQSRLRSGTTLPPSGSHSRCETRLVVSLIEMSCGPLMTDRSSFAPASGSRSGCSTISVPAIAARIASAAVFEAAGKDPDEAGDPASVVDVDAGGDLRIVPGMVEIGLGQIGLERARRAACRNRGTSSERERRRPPCPRARSSGFQLKRITRSDEPQTIAGLGKPAKCMPGTRLARQRKGTVAGEVYSPTERPRRDWGNVTD